MKSRFLTTTFALILLSLFLSGSFPAFAQTKRAATNPKTVPAEQIVSETNAVMSAAWNSGTLPAPLALPEGNIDEIAAILARKVAAKNEESIPALIAALQLAGFFITDKSGEFIVTPANGKGQGLPINGWEVASVAKMYGEARETTLTDLNEALKLFPALKNADVAGLLLSGIRRNAENQYNAYLRAWSRFIIELGKNSAAKYDILSGAKTEQVKLDAIQHLLIMRRIYGDAYARAERYKSIAGDVDNKLSNPNFQRQGEGKARFINAAFSPSENSLAPHSLRSENLPFNQTPTFSKAGFNVEKVSSDDPPKKDPPCQMDGNVPTIMDAAATGIGFGFDQFMGHLEDVWEATPAGQAVEKYGKYLGFANALLAYGKFIQTYGSLETKLVLEDAPPLIRTKNSIPGDRKKLRAEVRMNIGNWQMLNCARLALNIASGGADFSTATDGPQGGVGVRWHLDEGGAGDSYSNRGGYTGKEQIVGFTQDGATRIQDRGTGAGVGSKTAVKDLTYTKTDDQGIARIMLEGSPQKNAKIGNVSPVTKRAQVRATIKLKAGELKGDMVDVVGQALGGAGALVTMPTELLYRMDWASTGTLTVPVRDWEECAGGWNGTIEFSYREEENQTVVTKPGENSMTPKRTDTRQTMDLYRYNAVFNVKNSQSTT
ncbi:MAG TPA: hypothetical protein VK308_02110, partial [Pyrinomonadaceae bacterium]|nr:hypothetical protein [Pyrinomonadaceae bacterium]